tara:strand:- start:883 stop:1230 length:348 start_codon:yes stop_codon:yes gene_type:complete
MPRTVIEGTNVDPQGSVTLNFADADAPNGMMFLNDGSCVLVVRNEKDMDDVQVTIVAVPDEAGRAVDYVETVEAGDEQIFGFFRPAWWNQTVGNVGFVYVDLDDDTDISVGVINF